VVKLKRPTHLSFPPESPTLGGGGGLSEPSPLDYPCRHILIGQGVIGAGPERQHREHVPVAEHHAAPALGISPHRRRMADAKGSVLREALGIEYYI
jgi:hypothetical protein